MISLYKHGEQKGQEAVCPYTLGKQIGHSEKMVNTMLKLLARSNFVKKDSDGICITTKGKELVEQLISN